MEKMTLRELRDYLNSRTEEELSQPATVYNSSMGEYYSAEVIELVEGDDIIEAGTILIQFEV